LLSAEGLPLGVQRAGFAGEDARLFAIAAAFRDLRGAASRGAGAV
jgi:Asp-tRNA(Asn)/Glu-tRNA(Gln) amidotransferase A subunit family amidase